MSSRYPPDDFLPTLSIHEIAPLLYGPSWQTPLAEALGVSLRNVQRWAAGDRAPGYASWEKIFNLLQTRHAEISAIFKRQVNFHIDKIGH